MGQIIIAAGLIVSVCGAYLSWTIMAAEVPFLAATHRSIPAHFARQNAQAAPSASLWLTNICVQICLVLIWLTGSDYNTLLTIASRNDSGALFPGRRVLAENRNPSTTHRSGRCRMPAFMASERRTKNAVITGTQDSSSFCTSVRFSLTGYAYYRIACPRVCVTFRFRAPLQPEFRR